jgi:cell division protein FtsW (lipid II flippase)
MAPTKGIALPFVSAGGSGLVITAVAAGVLVNIARQRNQLQTDTK